MRVRCAADVVIKEAESEPERIRLGREASVLRVVAHPGVVQMAGLEGGEAPGRPDRLLLHPVAGTRLADAGAQPVTAIAGWGAAVATVLADLHDLGYAHGDIRPEHVLFDGQGRPVLCGFGSARRVGRDQAAAAFHADVAALVRLLVERLPPGEAALRRALSRWERPRPGRRAGARDLAATLVRRVPGAHVGPADEGSPGNAAVGVSRSDGVGGGPVCGEVGDGPGGGGPGGGGPGGGGAGCGPGGGGPGGGEVGDGPVRPPTLGPRRPALATPGRRRLVAAGCCAAGAVVTVVPVVALTRPSGRPPSAPTPTALPAYVLRSTPSEDPLVVVGRWGCGPATPAVLDARSGSVWIFSGWPARGTNATGHLIGRVGSADGLAVAAGSPGCDRLEVLRRGAPDLPVATGSRP